MQMKCNWKRRSRRRCWRDRAAATLKLSLAAVGTLSVYGT